MKFGACAILLARKFKFKESLARRFSTCMANRVRPLATVKQRRRITGFSVANNHIVSPLAPSSLTTSESLNFFFVTSASKEKQRTELLRSLITIFILFSSMLLLLLLMIFGRLPHIGKKSGLYWSLPH